MQIDYASIIGIPSSIVSYNIPLSSRTWIHRGGNAKVYFTPQTYEQILSIAQYLYSQKVKFDVIGHSSNIYFKNSYCADYILDTKKYGGVEFLDDSTILATAGLAMTKLSRMCMEHGIAGYEGFVSLPGTVGGAVVNNSGCYGSLMEDVVRQVELLTPDGGIKLLSKEALHYSHRNSALKDKTIEGVVLRVWLDTSRHDSPAALLEKAERYTLDRKRTQQGPLNNLGSTYAQLPYKRNARNFICRVFAKLFSICKVDAIKARKLMKYVYLTLYGEIKIAKYVSNYWIGCFVWQDARADEAFKRYCKMMNRIYNQPRLEIEVRE
ncbi:MAG: FAD-binding protein [Paludibacteraceae bacterium]